MKTMTFQARELKDALAQIRQSLGPDALIMSTRQVAPLLGLGRPMLEVTAAAPEPPAPTAKNPDAAGAVADRRGAAAYRGSAAPQSASKPAPPSASRHAPHPRATAAEHTAAADEAWFREADSLAGGGTSRDAELDAEAALEARLLPLQREVRSLRNQLQQVAQRATASGTPALRQEVDDLRAVLQTMSNGAEVRGGMSAETARLMNLGIERGRAEQLVTRARALLATAASGTRDFEQALRKALTERVLAAGPVGVSARVAVFIGPTGVGKTTTIAKIAARASLMDGARVALITIDTFRVGAVDQLQRYADLMELPLHVAGTSAALRAAVRSNQSADLILVDTAGRGPRDVAQLAALREVLGATEPLEVHLCLSATTRAREQALAIHSYRPLRPSRLCITKLDEAISLGEILNLHESSRLPMSYFGIGQRVPEDLELCTPEAYVERLFAAPPPAAQVAESSARRAAEEARLA